MFDVYLPIVVLAPATIYFVSSDLSAPATAIVSGSIFAATLVGRPLGAIIFGHFADAIGRRRTTIISITGFGVCTLLMALLPGYQQWGVAAVIALIILRLVDGAFIGGEYSAANPLAMEYSPKEKRGLYAGIIQSGYPLAFAAISAITAVLLFLLTADGLNSPYVQWGWRIPFFIGAVLAFVMAAYFYFFVDESELFEASGGTESPLKTLFSGENLKNFLQVFVLMSGFWLSLNTVSAVLPGLLRSQVGLSNTNVTITLVIAYITVALAFVGAGVLSQRIGRRTLLMWLGGLMAVVGTFLYYLLIGTASDNLLMVILLTTIITVLVSSNWGLATSYINERFHTSVRASGFGIGYSLAVILPSFYAFYQAGLAAFMPFEYTALPLLVIGAVLILAGAAWGPETKDVDFSEDVREAGETADQATETSPRTTSGADRTAAVALRLGVPGGRSRPDLFWSEKEGALA